MTGMNGGLTTANPPDNKVRQPHTRPGPIPVSHDHAGGTDIERTTAMRFVAIRLCSMVS